jgi:catechol 2,3-dioxygenase-like lactoylglutathione lyase family enzyme
LTDETRPFAVIALAAVTLYVSDLDAAVSWYATALGLVPAMVGKDAERYASFVLGGTIIVLEPRQAALEAAAPGSESTTVNLVVDRDPADVRDELLARGVDCGALVASPHYHSFLMRDLDGNRFYVTRPLSEQGQADVRDARTQVST